MYNANGANSGKPKSSLLKKMEDTRQINLAIRQLGHGNPEPSRECDSRACVENMDSVPVVLAGSDMFQAFAKA